MRSYSYPASGQPRPHALWQAATVAGAGPWLLFDYDLAGNTVERTIGGQTQELSWDVEGRLVQVDDGADTSSMIYDAGGQRLVRRDGVEVTVFLPHTEVVWDARHTVTDDVDATRYVSHAGQVVATVSGTDPADWVYHAVDHHGTTATHTVNAFTGVHQVRRMDPYGNPRGTAPPAWPGQQGYVGGVHDPTGLIHIGARPYDPIIGRFATVDPILNVADDQQINGYSYAHANPITYTDPTGLLASMNGVPCIDGDCSYHNPDGSLKSRAECGASRGCGRTPSAGSTASGGGQNGCRGSACPRDTVLSCQSNTVDIGGPISDSYACPVSDTDPTYMSLGKPPRYCDFWYSDRCNRLTNAEVGLDMWWMLSCLSRFAGLASGTACSLMNHYIGATGADVPVDVDMLFESPEFSLAVNRTLAKVADRARGMCSAPPCSYSFDSGWTPMSFQQDQSEELFYAYRGMTYQVRGTVVVSAGPDGRPTADVTYTATAYKSWNFDREETLQGVSFSGPADAAGFGLAREFAVVGTSRTRRGSF